MVSEFFAIGIFYAVRVLYVQGDLRLKNKRARFEAACGGERVADPPLRKWRGLRPPKSKAPGVSVAEGRARANASL
jgi:hypothetical protein